MELLLLGLFFYLLPTLIAMVRMRANTMAIFALNLFLGWSVVGWVVSLVWALSSSEVGGTSKIESTAGKVKCPSCAEYIQPDAKKCRFCGDSLVRRGIFGKLQSASSANAIDTPKS
jgi:hypothetical protein